MKVILQREFPSLGSVGEVVTVKDGYARNFLIPQKIAIPADTKNIRQLEHMKRLVAANQARQKREAEELAKKLESASCTIPMMVGEQDKLFGSVTAKDIEEALAREGLQVSRKKIVLDEPLKKLGVFVVDVKLHPEVVAKLKVWVVAK